MKDNVGRKSAEIMEGYFYPLADYCKIIDPDFFSVKRNAREMVALVTANNEKVVYDDSGELGVEQVNLPQGAKHKFSRSKYKSKEVTETTVFSDEEKTAEDYATLVTQDQEEIDSKSRYAGIWEAALIIARHRLPARTE